MADKTILTLATSLFALAASQAAADVTADDVWADIEQHFEGGGYTISASDTSRAGATLTLEDVVATTDANGLDMVLEFGDLRLRESGDGTVDVLIEDVTTGTFSSEGNGSPLTGRLSLAQDGLSLVASGDPDRVTYAFDAQRISFTAEGHSDGRKDGKFRLDMEVHDPAGSTKVTAGDALTALESAFASKRITFKAMIDEQGLRGNALKHEISGSIDDLDLDYNLKGDPRTLEMLQGSGIDDPALLQTFSFDEKISYGGARYSIDFSKGEPGANMAADLSLGKGSGTFAMTGRGMALSSAAENISVNFTSLPAPLPQASLTIGDVSSDVLVPFPPAPGSDPRPAMATLKTSLHDVAPGDSLWGMIDPLGMFPHDPISFELDASLRGAFTDRTRIDSGPELLAALSTAQLNTLLFEGLGVDVSASGQVSFEGDRDPMTGIKAPVGYADVHLAGIDELLSSLTQSGMLPQEYLPMIGMMLNGYTQKQPNGDRDAAITFNEDASVFVNGSRVK